MSLAGYSRWATWEKSILFDFIWDTQTACLIVEAMASFALLRIVEAKPGWSP